MTSRFDVRPDPQGYTVYDVWTGEAAVIALPQGAVVGGSGAGAGASILDRGMLSVLDNQVDPTTGTIDASNTSGQTADQTAAIRAAIQSQLDLATAPGGA